MITIVRLLHTKGFRFILSKSSNTFEHMAASTVLVSFGALLVCGATFVEGK